MYTYVVIIAPIKSNGNCTIRPNQPANPLAKRIYYDQFHFVFSLYNFIEKSFALFMEMDHPLPHLRPAGIKKRPQTIVCGKAENIKMSLYKAFKARHSSSRMAISMASA